MKKYIALLIFSMLAFSALSYGADCESKKIIFKGHFKMAGTTADGKKALFKEAWYPLIEDWSEASGEILGVSVTGLQESQAVMVTYTDKNKKQSGDTEYKVVKGKLVNFDWKKSVGPNSGRTGELVFSVMGKDKQVYCQKKVNIQWADQLDR